MTTPLLAKFTDQARRFSPLCHLFLISLMSCHSSLGGVTIPSGTWNNKELTGHYQDVSRAYLCGCLSRIAFLLKLMRPAWRILRCAYVYLNNVLYIHRKLVLIQSYSICNCQDNWFNWGFQELINHVSNYAMVVCFFCSYLQILAGELMAFFMKSEGTQEKTIVTADCCYFSPLLRRIIRFLGNGQ